MPGDPGGSAPALALDRVDERTHLGIAACGLNENDGEQRAGPLGYLAAHPGVQKQAGLWILRLEHGLGDRPFDHWDRLVVAGERDVVDRLENGRLVADDVVDALRADLGQMRDRADRGADVSAAQEEVAGRPHDFLTGGPDLVGSGRSGQRLTGSGTGRAPTCQSTLNSSRTPQCSARRPPSAR